MKSFKFIIKIWIPLFNKKNNHSVLIAVLYKKDDEYSNSIW